MDLGLDTLSDDQLVELARAIAAEFVKRNPAVADAAQSAIRDEIARATQSQDALWTKKKWLAQLVKNHVGGNCELSVWKATDRAVTRVYLDQRGSDRRGRDSIKWCLHVSGDSKNPPGTLTCDEGSRASATADASVVKLICQHAVAAFTSVRIDCDKAAATDYHVPAEPQDVTDAVAAAAAAKHRAEARRAYRAERRDEVFAEYDAAVKEALAASGQPHLSLSDMDRLRPMRAQAEAALIDIMTKYDAEHGEV